MADDSATNVAPRSRRLKRIVRWIFLALFVLVVVAAIVGASYEAIGNSADARRFPQQGQSFSLGTEFANLKLNLDCQGQGSPTVILDSGLGVPGVGWRPVQMEAAKFTRVCWYDRAGYGWSDASAAPRTSLQIVKELHALLTAANEKGPFVLVGHSFGGYNVRVYNGQYPTEVVGMVLVDASHEDQRSRMPPGLQATMAKAEEQLKRQEMLAPLLIRFGIARFTQRSQPPPQGVSKEFAQEMQYLQMQTKFIEASGSELSLFSPQSADQVRAAGNLEDKPLVVLTAGKNVSPSDLPPGTSMKDFDDFHQIWVNELQVKEANLSTRGKRIIVADSDHMIPFERPDAIVDAIRDVCADVNAGKAATATESASAGSR
jgi:pimeloyl-ACP methyl ester carboxylesterase